MRSKDEAFYFQAINLPPIGKGGGLRSGFLAGASSLLKTLFFFILGVMLVIALGGCTSTPKNTSNPSAMTQTSKPVLPANTTMPSGGSTPVAGFEDQSPALLPAAQAELALLPDLTRYDIDLVIDSAAQTFSGQARVDVTNTEGQPLESLYFRLLPNGGQSYGNGSLTVSDTRVIGDTADTILSLNNTLLEVKLPQVLQPGERVQVEFDFQGIVPLDFGGDASPYAYGIYNKSEGVLALSGWYPILAVYDEGGWHLDPISPIGDSVFSETALYTVRVTMPSDLVLVSTGVEISRESLGATTKYLLVSGPMRDFFMIASPDFQVVSQIVDGTRVNSYYFSEDEYAGAVGLSVSAESLRVFNQRFGKYPYIELDMVQAPMRNALGVEFPGIYLIGASLYDEPDTPDFAVTVAHEVAHQWWYSLVGNDVFAEPWLDEALSTYSSGIYYQDVLGDGAYSGLASYWQSRYDTLIQDGEDDVITRDLKYFESLGVPRVYSGVVYRKGALFFKALREAIGDSAFFDALQGYYLDNKYGVANGDELLAAFEQASGQELDDLYNEWLYTSK